MPIMWDAPVWGADPVGESPFAVAPLKLAHPRTSTQAEERSSSPFHHRQQTSLDDQNNDFYLGAGAPQGLGINGLAAHPPYRHQAQYSSVTKPPTPEERSYGSPPVQPPPRNPHQTSRGHRSSTWRPPSSIYSQHSPTTTEFAIVAPPQKYGAAAGEISPPSSPDLPARGPKHGRDVSPIDEGSDMSQREGDRAGQQPGASQQRSNIPMMRRERRKHQEAAANTLRDTRSKERLRDRNQPPPPAETDRDSSAGSVNATGREVFKLAKGKEMKWDAMTGEPTLAQTGRSGQVKPAEYAQGFGGGSSSAISMLRNAQLSFGDKFRKVRGAPAGESVSSPTGPTANTPSETAPAPPPHKEPFRIENRPGWKGASGRTTLVDPVRDTRTVAPLDIPRKSSRRTGRGAVGGGVASPLSPVSSVDSETSSREALTIRKIVPSSQQAVTSIPSPLASPATQPAAQAYPSPPNSGTPIPPTHAQASTLPDAYHQSLSTPNPADANISEKAIRRKPPPSAHNNLSVGHRAGQPSNASSVYSVQPEVNISPPPRQSSDDHKISLDDPWHQPASRFSVTTYATSANTGSPRISVDDDAPPMPGPPQSSILDRKRPKLGGSDTSSTRSGNGEPIVISMNSAWMASPFKTSNDRGISAAQAARNHIPPHMRTAGRMTMASMFSTDSRTSSIMSTSKALPPAPPELLTANDRVAYLNAKLEGLANRRININKSIKQMTELMPTDNLLASEAVIRKREAEKMKVEMLKQELADVQREEYELGLKLHRAYKRLDRDAEFEPTTLWVRRVTN